MSLDQDKKAGVDALSDFFKQFGPPDVYNKILLEVLLEELFGINSDDKEVKNEIN